MDPAIEPSNCDSEPSPQQTLQPPRLQLDCSADPYNSQHSWLHVLRARHSSQRLIHYGRDSYQPVLMVFHMKLVSLTGMLIGVVLDTLVRRRSGVYWFELQLRLQPY